jgi:hypothetical protein
MALSKSEKMLMAALPDDESIKFEYNRLMQLFKTVPKDKISLARKLISRAAFLAVTIDELEKDISKNGYEEEYRNGEFQYGKKKSAAAELHVTYTKNLIAVMKQLNDMLDIKSAGGGDPFESF